MQYTNFLRDIVEDYKTRNRIYLPEAVLMEYGLDHDTLIQIIHEKSYHDRLAKCVEQEAKKCKDIYDTADQGIVHLKKH
jgi:phytoene/squalene synthetase